MIHGRISCLRFDRSSDARTAQKTPKEKKQNKCVTDWRAIYLTLLLSWNKLFHAILCNLRPKKDILLRKWQIIISKIYKFCWNPDILNRVIVSCIISTIGTQLNDIHVILPSPPLIRRWIGTSFLSEKTHYSQSYCCIHNPRPFSWFYCHSLYSYRNGNFQPSVALHLLAIIIMA